MEHLGYFMYHLQLVELIIKKGKILSSETFRNVVVLLQITFVNMGTAYWHGA